MTAQEQIDRVNKNIADTYAVLESKGATMPSARNSDNLPQTAASIVSAKWTESTEFPGCFYIEVGQEREWLNPPMSVGVEYRTAERNLGKPVYAKVVEYTPSDAIGTTSGTATVYIDHGISNFNRPIRVDTTFNGTSLLPYVSGSGCVTAISWISATQIVLRIEKTTHGAGQIWRFTIYYQKS